MRASEQSDAASLFERLRDLLARKKTPMTARGLSNEGLDQTGVQFQRILWGWTPFLWSMLADPALRVATVWECGLRKADQVDAATSILSTYLCQHVFRNRLVQ